MSRVERIALRRHSWARTPHAGNNGWKGHRSQAADRIHRGARDDRFSAALERGYARGAGEARKLIDALRGERS